MATLKYGVYNFDKISNSYLLSMGKYTQDYVSFLLVFISYSALFHQTVMCSIKIKKI